ncbi:MAG: Smr/MutS family protein [Bacteroidetes bacterium]|nr:Smr/MutS family protein [Bacteroidota bacterium]
MKLRIGDKVRFLNETGEGKVSRIKDKNTVFVEMPDGFEIPYLTAQLVPIHTELIIDRDAENIELSPDAQLTDAVYFIIEPDHEFAGLISDYRIYLFNASSFNLLYSYSIKDGEYYQTLKHGEIGAYQKILLKTVKINYFKEYNYQKVDCILYKNGFFKAQFPIAEILFLSPETLRDSKTIKHEEFEFPVFGFLLKEEFLNTREVEQRLTDEDIKRVKSIKEFKSKTTISKSKKEYLRSLEKEVDLHIEELMKNTKGLSNYEMLNIQLERVERELDEAMAKNMKKIVFIHGVGNGRLKQEIVSILKSTKGVTYQDASYKDYGFGATQVNIL